MSADLQTLLQAMPKGLNNMVHGYQSCKLWKMAAWSDHGILLMLNRALQRKSRDENCQI